jgi:type I restriction enzyme R subunit
VNEKEKVQAQINQIIAKLQRKKHRMDGKTMEQFISMSGGMDPTQFIIEIEKQKPEEAKKRLLAYRDMFAYIQETKANGNQSVVISD